MCAFCQSSRRRLGQMLLGAAVTAAAPRHPALAKAKPFIMIDAGHGGHDCGAIAPDGLYEKTITLAAAFAVRRALLATGRFHVGMTRNDDSFIPLQSRVNKAMNANADLFIALHCDHLPEPDLRGASIFTLSPTASDALSAGLARDDNTDRTGPAPSPQLASILASLETRATRVNSANFAQEVHTALAGKIPLLPNPDRSANFAVLRDPSIPSILLEMGCLTNPADETLLRQPTHRTLIANRLTQAIDSYFNAIS